MNDCLSFIPIRQVARAARHELEAALAANGWPYSCTLSRRIDSLVILEESGK